LFHGNAFVGGATGGCQLKLEASNCIVVGNTFDGGNSSHQLRINGGDNLAVGNRFHNVGSAAGSTDGRAGVLLDNVSGCLVTNNTFASIASGQGYADSAVRFIFGAQNNAVRGNAMSGSWQTAAINLADAGSRNVVRDNTGYTAQVTTPGLPASGVDFTHSFAVECMVYISGGTVSNISIGGVATGLTSGAFRVGVSQKISLTYTVAPQWVWVSE
jgi:hypothetical protein